MKPNNGSLQCCKKCDDFNAEFQKVLDLKKTGLVVYRHKIRSEEVNKYVGVPEFAANVTEDTFILHNTKNVDITSDEYLPEIEINAIPCARCRKIAENAQKIIVKIPTINKNELKGICEHCRMKATSCLECKEVVKKFIANKNERTENTKEKVKQWLSKVKCLLKDSTNNIKGDKVRAHSELHIDELCRDVPKARVPEVKQMFHDGSDFIGAFPQSIEKRKTMFTHLPASETPKHLVFVDQPEVLGKPSTSRLNPDFSTQDHDKGYYSDVDSEDMRTMFHPALTDEVKQRKTNTIQTPSIMVPKDNANVLLENDLGLARPTKTYKSNEDLITINKELQTGEISRVSELPRLRHGETGTLSHFIRRIHSEESLHIEDTSATTGARKRDFHFFFPKTVPLDSMKLKRHKSSSELIRDTQDMLVAKFEENKKKQEEELIKKLEEREKKIIAVEENKKQLAFIEADEGKKKHVDLVTKSREYGRQIKSAKYKKETIDEKGNVLYVKPSMSSQEETKTRKDQNLHDIPVSVQEVHHELKTKPIMKRETKTGKDSLQDEFKEQSKQKISTENELKYKGDVKAQDITSVNKQINKNILMPKETKTTIEIDTKSKLKETDIDKQYQEKQTSRKKVGLADKKEPKIDNPNIPNQEEPGKRVEKDKTHEKEKVGTKYAPTTKIKSDQKKSEKTVYQDFKEPKTLKEPKDQVTFREVKEEKEYVEPKEKNEKTRDVKESKELKGQKEIKSKKEFEKLDEIKSSKGPKESSVDKKDPKSDKYDDNLKKDIEGKLQKQEKETSKKEIDEQRQIEKENKENEKEFDKLEQNIIPDKSASLKQRKGDSAAKQKKLDDKPQQEKQDYDNKDAEVPPPTLKIEKINVRRLSPDDLILRLVRLKQSSTPRDDNSRGPRLSDIWSGKGVARYKKQRADANNMCTASDIDFETDLLNFSKLKDEKKKVIIGDKIFRYKKPTQTPKEDALTKEREKDLRRQEIYELVQQRKLKKEMEEAAAKQKKVEDKARLEELEAERKKKEGTGLSYMIHVNLDAIKVRRPSPNDLILQLVRLKQSTRGRLERIKPKRLTDIKIAKKDIKIHKQRKNSARVLSKETDSEPESDRREEKKENKITEMIIGPKIFKYKPSMGDQNDTAPSFIQSTFDTTQEPILTTDKGVESSEHVTGKEVEHDLPKGVIRYALSDRTFIEKGWTMLPTEKVVRKMNVYRMRPAHPEFDWFEHNKNKRFMQYDTGEKLAEFDDEGRGRWFYRNGRMALDYYDAEELNAQQRFVIYSSGEPDERGRAQPYTLLATFDYLGNGVVFDHSGKIRLKYNQTEGVVLDRSIGPVSHWKWHTLNDPPVLQQVMIDTQMTHKDPNIIKLAPNDRSPRPDNEDMLAIEFDNFIKEKSKKLTQTFKPFQIKMKALKINKHFSLRVLDQATVYLLYRDGTTNLKLNIGMVLDHKEIVDTDTAELGEVSTNMERFPAKTDSLAGLQRSVAHAERYERLRVERELKIRPTIPRASVDKLVSAASHPMRSPLRLRTSQSSITTDSYCKCSRKPTSSNIYYDTRLC